jgi:error-prone DNA polymerase
VAQDVADLTELTSWERMEGEYRTLGLHPSGHMMEHLRKQLGEEVVASCEISGLPDGARVTVAGLVIRRQRPLAKAVFITLEDEHGHIPLVVWPKMYARLRHALAEPVIIARGTVSRREGTMNIVVNHAEAVMVFPSAPLAKNWV